MAARHRKQFSFIETQDLTHFYTSFKVLDLLEARNNYLTVPKICSQILITNGTFFFLRSHLWEINKYVYLTHRYCEILFPQKNYSIFMH